MTWRRAGREERPVALLWAAAATGALLLRPFWRVAAPFLPSCPMHVLTGLPCPTCGTTRAALALLDGRVLRALALNPLATAAGIALVVGGVAAPVWAALRGPLPVLPRPLPVSWRVGAVVALLLNWAWLVAHGV